MEAYGEPKVLVALVEIDASVTNQIRHRRAQICHKKVLWRIYDELQFVKKRSVEFGF